MPDKPSTFIQIRRDPETTARIERLARKWGPIEPLTATAVIKEALRRADDDEGGGSTAHGEPPKKSLGKS